MHTTAQVLEAENNVAVVQLAGRKYPGILIQGDSISILLSDLKDVRNAINKSDRLSASTTLDAIEERLEASLAYYESVLEKRGISLPYARA